MKRVLALAGARVGLVLVALCGMTSCGDAPVASRAAAAGSIVAGPLGTRIDDFLTRMSGFGYSGNVLVIQRGAVVLEKGYGLANRAVGTAYTPDTIFDAGSLSKQFTAAAVIQLEAAHRLSLGDTLSRHLAGVPPDKAGITIHQLLTHTSGIAADFPYTDPSTEYEDVARDDAVRRILAVPLEYEPGTDKAYSNCGYILLAAIVESASGEAFPAYMHRAVLGPAGLTHTGFWADPLLDPAQVAIGYDEYGKAVHEPMSRSATTWQDLGGGQMLSTLRDLERWRAALESGRFLPRKSVARMWTPWTKQLSSRDGDYGYGWFIQRTPRQTTVIQHGGDYLGTGAELEWYRDEGVVLITSTNVRHDLYPTRNRIDRVIPKILFGGDHPEPPSWVDDTALLRRALGTYRIPGGDALTIHERGGRFFIGADGQAATDLLMPGAASLRERRASLSAKTQRAMDDLRQGKPEELKELAGGEAANPEFVAAVAKEVAALGQRPVRACRVLGTFASGYPRGQPLDYETTLVQFDFSSGSAAYAIRWANEVIAATELPAFRLAADTPIQPSGDGGLVAWNIVFSVGVTMSLTPGGSSGGDLVLHSPDGDVVAARVREAKSPSA